MPGQGRLGIIAGLMFNLRMMPWDWLAFLLVHGVVLVGYASGWGESVERAAFLGPYVVQAPWGLVVRLLQTAATIIGGLGLILLAKWCWAFLFASWVLLTLNVVLIFTSGNWGALLDLKEDEILRSSFQDMMTQQFLILLVVLLCVLAWMLLRRKALKRVICSGPSMHQDGNQGRGGR